MTAGGRTFWHQQSPAGKAAILCFTFLPMLASVAGLAFVRVVSSTPGVVFGLSLSALYGAGFAALTEIGIRRSDPYSPEVLAIQAHRDQLIIRQMRVSHDAGAPSVT